MTTKLQGDFQRSQRMVPDSAAVLKRFYFVQRELVRMQAGWTPGTEHWETKLLLPEFLWEDALIATQLRGRVLELRFPERRMEIGADDACIGFWRALADAPCGEAFSCALMEHVKPAIHEAFRGYRGTSDSLNDAPTMRILNHAVADIEEQRKRGAVAHADFRASFPDDVQSTIAWVEAVGRAMGRLSPLWWDPAEEVDFTPALLELAPHRRSFAIARRGVRDRRFKRALFSWPDSLWPERGAGTGFELQVRQAQAHLNEVWAAEMAAACIYDLIDDGPPEFLEEAARWCFDELRHCKMGYTRFIDWGFSKSEMPMGSYSYDAGEPLDAISRLGIIFYFETTFIHTKSERTKSFAAFGDRTSSHDMDFDWADELIHTYYGKRWLSYFLEKEGRDRTTKQIKDIAFQSVQKLRDAATPDDKEATLRLYQETMARAGELAQQSSLANVVGTAG